MESTKEHNVKKKIQKKTLKIKSIIIKILIINLKDKDEEIFKNVEQKQVAAQSCLTLCNPTDCSMPGFPTLHHLPELA